MIYCNCKAGRWHSRNFKRRCNKSLLCFWSWWRDSETQSQLAQRSKVAFSACAVTPCNLEIERTQTRRPSRSRWLTVATILLRQLTIAKHYQRMHLKQINVDSSVAASATDQFTNSRYTYGHRLRWKLEKFLVNYKEVRKFSPCTWKFKSAYSWKCYLLETQHTS